MAAISVPPELAPFVPKVQVTLRLDAHILDYYRATGRRWQTRMNADLAAIVRAREERASAGSPSKARRRRTR